MVSTNGFDWLNDYVDLDRYPIHELDSSAGMALIGRAHEMMERDTLCLLEGFLRDSAVESLSAEITELEAEAHPVDYQCTLYSWRNNAGFPADHPRSQLPRRNCRVISTDQLTPASACMELFQFDELTEFVRRLLGYDQLYRVICPTLSIQINVMQEHECFGWHFDTNDGVVSFTIQNPELGGGFEYVPLIRNENDENYPAVARILDCSDLPRQAELSAGTFSLFLGRRSLHRVAPVGKTRVSRQSLLFSYDQKRNQVFASETQRRLSSASPEPYRGALSPLNSPAEPLKCRRDS